MIASSKYYPMDFTASEVLAMWNYGESTNVYHSCEPSRTASYFGRLNYAFKDRYMFNFTGFALCRRERINLKTVGDFSRVWHWHGAFPRKIYEADGRLAG